MKAKIITYLLIYCIIIEPSLLNMGCTSFYPSEGSNNPDDYLNQNDNILIRLKTGEELVANPKNIYFVDRNSHFIFAEGNEYNFTTKNSTSFEGVILPAKIDSEKAAVSNGGNYKIFWMQDSIKLVIEEKNLYSTVPDTQYGYWMLVNPYDKEFHKIYTNDIAGIEIQNVDWVKTSIAIVLGLGFIVGLIVLLSNSGSDSGALSPDCGNHNYSTDCGQFPK